MTGQMVAPAVLPSVYRGGHSGAEIMRMFGSGPYGNPILFIKDGETDSIGESTLKDSTATGAYLVESGHSLAFDGVMYGKLIDRDTGADSSLVVSGDFEISVRFNVTELASDERAIISTVARDTYIRLSPFILVSINGTTYSFLTLVATINTPSDLVVTRAGTQLTATLNGVSETKTSVTTGLHVEQVGQRGGLDIFVGNLHSLTISDSTGIIFSNPLAQDNTTGFLESAVGPHVELVNPTYPVIEKSNIFGHTWQDYSEYEVADDVYSTAGHLIVGKIPKDPATGLDVAGGALTHPGTPRRDKKVTGFTGDWDGLTTANMDSPITLVGDFRILSTLDISDSTDQVLLSKVNGDDIIRYNGSFWRIRFNAVYYEFTEVTPTTGVLGVTRSGSTCTLSIGGQTQTLTVPTTDFTLSIISLGGLCIEGPVPQIKIYNASDELIHHWICESASDSLQDTIYDVVGGNHASLVDATYPFFTVEKPGSALLDGGYTEGEPDGVEWWDDPTITSGAYTDPGDNVYTSTGIDGGLRKGILQVGDRCLVDYEILSTGTGTISLFIGGINTGVITDTLGRRTVVGSYSSTGVVDFYSSSTGVVLKVHSVQKIPIGLVPAGPDGLSALGQPLTHKPATLYPDSPVLLENIGDVESYTADQTDFVDLGVADGDELWADPWTQVVDANNYSEWDSETGIGRIVSDGTFTQMVVSNFTVGADEVVGFETLGTPVGLLKFTAATVGSDVILEDGIHITQSSTNLTVARYLACDVTFKLSVQKVISGPADIWFNANGTTKQLAASDLIASVNQQYSFGQKGLIEYDQPQTASNWAKVTKYNPPWS